MRSYNYLLFSYHLICFGVYFFTTVKIYARASVYLDFARMVYRAKTRQSNMAAESRVPVYYSWLLKLKAFTEAADVVESGRMPLNKHRNLIYGSLEECILANISKITHLQFNSTVNAPVNSMIFCKVDQASS